MVIIDFGLLEVYHTLAQEDILGKVDLVFALIVVEGNKTSLKLLDGVDNLQDVDFILSLVVLLISKFVKLCLRSLFEAVSNVFTERLRVLFKQCFFIVHLFVVGAEVELT